MSIRISKTAKSKIINLIPQDEFESSNFGRIIKWALSTFRVIVIVTELVVMSAFLSRFWLDAKNSDLNDQINSGKAQVLAYSDVENEFRSLQKRVDTAKQIYSETKLSLFVTEVSKFVPDGVTLKSVSVADNQITIRSLSSSELAISQFLINLEESENLKDITLSQISSNADNSSMTTFTVTATIIKK